MFWLRWNDVRYGGREEPDSLDDKPMGTYFNISEAVANFVEQVFLCRSKDYWRDLSDRAYADSVMSDAEFY